MPILFEKCRREEGYDPLRDNIEWQPAYESNKLGIRADVQCKTDLEGLFAAGMARTLGINPFTGWSIASCTWSGYTAGENAALYGKMTDLRNMDHARLAKSREDFLVPAMNDKGVEPDKVVHDLQKILFPAGVLILMKDDELKKALDSTLRLRNETMASMQAGDARTLIKAKEAQTMLLSAEMTLRAARMRQETRESIYYREDFPERDNRKWLKWILVEKKGDEMSLTKEPIPFERYRFSPDR